MQLKKFACLLVVAFALLACVEQESEEHPLLGQKMPYLKIQNMMGAVTRMQPHGFDKPALVNLWATWCKPCIKEMPVLEELARQGDYRVIAISNDANKQVVSKFIADGDYQKIQFFYDAFGKQSRSGLNAQGLPMTFLVDRDTTVRHVFVGEEDWLSDAEVVKILNKYKVKYDD